MAHECFENPAIARLMNDLFINIKVDREERPDLDDIYMNAVQMMTGRGGWPLTVFLTPDLKPFYGGTYFPPEDRGGLPSFPRLLQALADSYRQKKDNIANVTEALTHNLQALAQTPSLGMEPALPVLDQAYQQLTQDFDSQHGGFGTAPKFPPSLDLGFLARYYYRTRQAGALNQITFTLTQMARGGLYDQLGGGFHRYSVDAQWLVPHFEKMLYDNALLILRYLEASQLTGNSWYAQIAQETLDYVLAEMTSPNGGFYAAQDADSEGVEGKFFAWTPAEIAAVVGAENAPLVCAAFGVTQLGNFEPGANVLHRPLPDTELAQQFGISLEQLQKTLTAARHQLKAARESRIRPHRDEKIITAWNGLMISAMVRGAQVLGLEKYQAAAKQCAGFILSQTAPHRGLPHLCPAESTTPTGFLDDYAFFTAGLLDLFETDFDPGWLSAALQLTDELERKFYDPQQGGYFFTADDHEQLIVRPKNFFDHAIPSGGSMVVHNLLRLHRFTEQTLYQERAQDLLSRLQDLLSQHPRGLGNMLAAQEEFLAPALDLTLVGNPADEVIRAMLNIIYRHYLPHRRLMLKNPQDFHTLASLVPAVNHYDLIDDRPTAFVCQGFTCQEPVHTPDDLKATLARLTPA
jgi:hypothetical protein